MNERICASRSFFAPSIPFHSRVFAFRSLCWAKLWVEVKWKEDEDDEEGKRRKKTSQKSRRMEKEQRKIWKCCVHLDSSHNLSVCLRIHAIAVCVSECISLSFCIMYKSWAHGRSVECLLWAEKKTFDYHQSWPLMYTIWWTKSPSHNVWLNQHYNWFESKNKTTINRTWSWWKPKNQGEGERVSEISLKSRNSRFDLLAAVARVK